jgi:hypothetical protein
VSAWDGDAPQRLAAALEQIEEANRSLRDGLREFAIAARDLDRERFAETAQLMDADRLLGMSPLAMLRSDVVAMFSVRIERRHRNREVPTS